MDHPPTGLPLVATLFRQCAKQLLSIGVNRLELLAVEIEEAREHLLIIFLLALGVIICSTLVILTLSVAIVLFFWNYSPLLGLLILSICHCCAGFTLYVLLKHYLRAWKPLSSTLEQLGKDRQCLEKLFE